MTLLLFLYTYTLLYLRATADRLLAPMTGDLNMMIIIAVILIAAFMIFILLKSGKRKR